jgi:hypothetical protein
MNTEDNELGGTRLIAYMLLLFTFIVGVIVGRFIFF